MAGHRRRRCGAPSSQQGAGSSSLENDTLSTREVTIVEKPGSTSSGPYACADPLDSLLHEIIVLINSFKDFLAFSGTWRAAVSSFPSVYAFNFPPIHLEPDGPYVPPHSRGFKPLCLSNCKWIYQAISFKGHIFVIDSLMRLHNIQLTPQFRMQEVAVTSLQCLPLTPWLVVCGDMLLMVDLAIASLTSFSSFGEPNDTIRFFKVFCLDFSVQPTRWVQLEKLENHALFLSLDRRNSAFSCVNPERWEGKSNCVYVAKLLDDANPEETWTVLEVGQSVPHQRVVDTMMYGLSFPPDYSQIGSLWLFPSLVYGASR